MEIHVLLIILLHLSFCDTSTTTDIEIDQLDGKSICVSDKCIVTAYAIEDNMNSNMNPCTDFYEFVCGEFMNVKEIPQDDYMVNSTTHIVEKQFKELQHLIENINIENETKPFEMLQRFYNECIHLAQEDRYIINRMEDFIYDLGGWPVLETEWNENEFNLLNVFNHLYKKGYSSGYLFKFSMELDPLKLDTYILTIDQPELIFKKEIFREGFFTNRKVKQYYNYLRDIALYFDADIDRVSHDLNETMEFEWQLLNISLSKEERSRSNSSNIRMNIIEFQIYASSIDWLGLINNFLNEDNFIDCDEFILVKVVEYLKKLSDLIRNTPKRIVANYLLWKIVAETVPFLTNELRELYFQHNTIITGQVERKPLWRECVENAIKYFPAVTTQLYTKSSEYTLFVNTTIKILDQMKLSLKETINDMNWMNSRDKLRAIDKIKAISYHIGYWQNLTTAELTEYYRDVSIYSISYLDSVLSILKNNKEFFLSRLKQPVSHTKHWINDMSMPCYGASYIHEKNTIFLPVWTLNYLNAEPSLPVYTKFAGIGVIIGRAMSQTYNRMGRLFDQYGESHNWCHDNCDEHFLYKDQCVIDQYNDFMLNMSTKAAGYLTQDENIADVEGVNMAYEAYHRWLNVHNEEPYMPGLNYTNRQMFWIWYASLRCAKYRSSAFRSFIKNGDISHPRFRVNNPLRNSDNFSYDFNCSVTDYMYLDNANKCFIN